MSYSVSLGKFNFSKGIFNGVKNTLFNGSTRYSEYSSDSDKLDMVFSNPAVLKVITLQCDLFSLAKIEVRQKGDIVEKDPFLKFIKKPNPFQSQSQFLWDYMFWLMLGNTILHINDLDIEGDNNSMYLLQPSKLVFPRRVEDKIGKLMLSKKSVEEFKDLTVDYDGKENMFKIKQLIFFTDLTNGTGNWLKGSSRIDALRKIISNSEAGIDSKNITTRYLGKYMVSGKIDETNVNLPMMKDGEKKDIENKIDGSKKVYAVKTPVDIKRFVEDSGVLENLDKSYLADYYKVGKLYNIPRDVLEAYESSTYENQEKAKGSHVSYTLDPKGCDLGNSLASKIGYVEEDKEICLTWSHLPFMQVFEKDKAEVLKSKAKVFSDLVKSGVKPESAAKTVGLELDFKNQNNE